MRARKNIYQQCNKQQSIDMITKIKVKDYYGTPSYYSVMPRAIFDALEVAALNGEEYVDVEKDLFDKMLEDYNQKMKP